MGNERRVQAVYERYEGETSEHIRKLAQSLNGLLKGQANNYFDVTLVPGETETEVRVEYARPGAMASLSAASASAAATAGVWTEVLHGVIVVHHDNSEATDRRFVVVLVG
jgi:hypothetical protein